MRRAAWIVLAGLLLPAAAPADPELARKGAREVLADFHKREGYTYVMTERAVSLARDEGKSVAVRLLAGVGYLAIAAGDGKASGLTLQLYHEDEAKAMTRVGELRLDEPLRKALAFRPAVSGKYYVFVKGRGDVADVQLYLASQKPGP